ncbi:MAG: chromate efflux transporter, partial [Candidatus Poribacteria bacterium]|nr:chromate efflux transporter [Candidatus Poribacteria bacterium]
MQDRVERGSPTEIASVFFRLGVFGFGGPAAHIAMMEQEVVERRRWLSRERFLDLVGATNLIPGPNSTEMAIHLGYLRGGLLGFVIAGVCFIVPAVLMTTLFAVLYVRYGSLPEVAPFLVGVKPAALSVIFFAMWRLGVKAVRGWQLAVVGVAVFAASLLGVPEILALLGGGIVGMLWLRGLKGVGLTALVAGLFTPSVARAASDGETTRIVGVTTLAVFLFFLKIGAILYGGGYVLVAFLEGELVHERGWLTQQQLLDAIALGQFTPGPILSTAAFIGYLMRGMPGAVVGAVGIFLPSFLFVLALNPIVPALRRSAWTGAF